MQIRQSIKNMKEKSHSKITCIPGTDENYPLIAPVNISIAVIVNDSSVHLFLSV